MIDTEIPISMTERSSGWAINYCEVDLAKPVSKTVHCIVQTFERCKRCTVHCKVDVATPVSGIVVHCKNFFDVSLLAEFSAA